MFCIPKEFSEKIKQAVRKGELNPENLPTDSAARRAEFAKYMDEGTAKEVNLLFEKKLLLKDQERAMYDFFRDVTGLSKADKEALAAKIKETFAKKQERMLNPKDNEDFLNELASDIYGRKYKTDISLEEAESITNLTADLAEAKRNLDPVTGKFPTQEEALKAGSAKVALDNYVGDLKLQSQQRPITNPFKAMPGEKLRALGDDVAAITNAIFANTKSLKSSIDNSLWGNQALPVLQDPRLSKIWWKDFQKSWVDIAQSLGGKNVVDAAKAEVMSRPNYWNGRYDTGTKLALGLGEEAFPTSAPEKIPVLGKLFKASNAAYEAGAMRLRADIADLMYQWAEKSGEDLADKAVVGSINRAVNSITGRGNLGVFEQGANSLNKVLFSPRFAKSVIDDLTFQALDRLTPFARRQRTINILSRIGTTVAFMGLASALGLEVEWDHRSSKGGGVKIPGTDVWLNPWGRVKSWYVLATRIARQSTKTSKGKIIELGPKYGQQNGMDKWHEFVDGKLSPIVSTFKDVAINRSDYKGDPLTVGGVATNLLAPISPAEAIKKGIESGLTDALITYIIRGLGF